MLVYIDNFITFIVSLFIIYDLLLLAQQNHYHLSYVIKYYKKIIHKFDIYIYLFAFIKIFNINKLIDLVIVVSLIILYIIFIIVKIKQKKIIPLKITSRIKRNIIVNMVLLLIIILLLGFNVCILLLPLITLISFLLLSPLEFLINYRYIKKAKNKLDRIKPLVIGITGSAGKTSVKNFLYNIIKDDRITYASPKSYNTLMGLCKFINEEVNIGAEIIILEYGASKKGDIEKLLKFVKPDIGILTNVLPQHLETFKNINNIKKEKEKLLRNSRVSIYNCDILNIDNLNNLVIKVGMKNSDLLVSDLYIDEFGSRFKINGINYQTSLLGKCNYENILLAITCSLYLGIDIDDIVTKINDLEQVENRLEVKKVYDTRERIIVNDSFNSNIVGFKNALEVLSFFKGSNKVIITPGIVEGGKEEGRINKEIAEEIVKYNIEIFLIETSASAEIEKVLNENSKLYFRFKSFKEAYRRAIDDDYDVILIENDVSDIYLK